ncbi:cytochrome P450 [Dendryphion nanum]|uniref:Cytochrome P450 n=1 Tax=Dendryphion nanum TaxID=256645 RepID=A0A9P9D6Y4_9PLEO|nr:cytochrome P450 [Dendryphion nanum]
MAVTCSSSALDSHAHVDRHPIRRPFCDLENNLNMLDHFSQVLAPSYQFYALGAAIALFACASAYALVAPRQPPKFPAPQLYDETGPIDLIALDKTIKEGFQNYKGKYFTLKESHGETVILPTQFMEELKALPDNMLNLDDEIDERFLSEYSLFTTTSVGGRISTVVNSVKNELTKTLGNLMGDIHEEVVYSFQELFPPCDDWTEVDIQSKLVRIVALVSGRIFVGLPMSRNQEYLDCIIEFTLNVFFAVPEIRAYPRLLRWTSRYLNTKVRAVHKSLATMRRLMAPIITDTKRQLENGTGPHNMCAWNIKNSNQKERDSLNIQAQMQLATSMAAIHTTSMTVTNAIFDLAARPEYLQPLRDELQDVRASESSPYLNKTSMPKLRKLDSFLKESHRLSPISLLNMRRKIVQPITLHDGTVLQPGMHIAFPLHQISNDEDLWENPSHFDGFRFQKLRELPGNESKYQFTATGANNLDFGYGVHACPGRFFAANEIKMILIHLIDNFEFKFKGDIERPDSLWTPGGYHPNPSVRVLLKRRLKA